MSIKNKEQFDEYLTSNQSIDSIFSMLSEDDLAFFKAQLKFSKNGNPSSYWGDVMRVSKMNEREFLKLISSIFGLDEKEFEKSYHSFGDGQGHCVSRLFWNCPYQDIP